MKSIPIKILNQRASLISYANSKDVIGGMIRVPTVRYTNVPIRITNFQTFSENRDLKPLGFESQISHIAFILPDQAVEIGWYVNYNNKEYQIYDVDDEPGGVLNHHKELFLIRVKK